MPRDELSYCRICAAACGIVVTIEGDEVLRVRGDDDHPVSRGYTCSKGRGLAAWHHSPRRLVLILLAAYSGLRWGELAGLRRRYLDPLHKTVRVVEQCTEVNGHFVWGPPKTSAGTRTVVLPSFICDVMVEHLACWSEPGVEGLVFVMPEGTPLRRENFRKRVWLPACAATGVEGVRFHDLRHTNATLAAASGARLRAVMHRLGHASAAAALRYQHRMTGQDEAIADFLQQVAIERGPSTQTRNRTAVSP